MSDDQLRRGSPTPLWQQLAAILRRQIEAGEITGRLPGEHTLTARYGCSRDTVRKALEWLAEQEGLIERSHGRGWFVIER